MVAGQAASLALYFLPRAYPFLLSVWDKRLLRSEGYGRFLTK
jgi:hypothetical protein